MEEMELAMNQPDHEEVKKTESPRWYEGHISLEDAKTFIKANIATAARSFIAIGFYLKCVRDRELFLEENHPDVWEFARAEYGISKSTASRYMSMNDRFSENGNSPNVREEYRAYGKSQLQEMLYLEEEQLEQVKPEYRVEDIRGMRKPKEVPYIELPGQMEIEIDFPEYMPDPPASPMISQKQTFEMSVEDMLSGEGQDVIAISQQDQEPEPEEIQDTEERKQEPSPQPEPEFYNPDDEKKVDESYSMAELPGAHIRLITMLAQLFVRENVRRLFGNGEFIGITDEDIIDMLKLFQRRNRENIIIDDDVEVAVCAEIIEFSRGDEDLGVCSFKKFTNFARKQIDEYISQMAARERKEQGLAESDSKEPETVIETPETVSKDPESVPDPPETVIDGEFVEVPPEPEEQADEAIAVFGYSAQDIAEEMATALKLLKLTPENLVNFKATRKLRIRYNGALLIKKEFENHQYRAKMKPILPILKNNDQRADFVDAYETWPLWIETKETGERYYRYDLPDGTSMVIKVYHARIFDYKASGSYEDKLKEGWGEAEYYLLREGAFFRNCKTSRSELIDKLKVLQGKGKGET